MLYRCTKKLRDESEANEVEPVCARIRYMKEMLLPKCYVAFTRLVRDNQFSAIGLALVAELARIHRTISVRRDFANDEIETPHGHPEVEIAKTLSPLGPTDDPGEAVERSSNLDSIVQTSTTHAASKLPPDPVETDVGQRPSGWHLPPTKSLDGPDEAQSPNIWAAEPLPSETDLSLFRPPRKQNTKTRKQANPIDDIFDGLE